MQSLAEILPRQQPTNGRLSRFLVRCWSRDRGVMMLEVLAGDFFAAAELLKKYEVEEVFDLRRTDKNVRYFNVEQVNELR
jgi:hypothetical protein